MDAYVCVEGDTSPHEAREALTLAAIISVQALTPDQGCMVLQKAERVGRHKGGDMRGEGGSRPLFVEPPSPVLPLPALWPTQG